MLAVDGSSLFWSSGTWVLFAGQLLTLAVVVAIYRYQGRAESRRAESDDREGGTQR